MRTFLLLTALWMPLLSFAQNDDKRDYVWLLGYPPNSPAQGFGGSMIDFNYDPPKTSFFNVPFFFQAISMISDPEGKIQFYSNGCHIVNREHKIMQGGSPLNPGQIFDDYCKDWGYPLAQSILTLPHPDSAGVYSVFHLTVNYVNNMLACDRFLYTGVNMNLNNGLGAVTSRNRLLSTQLSASCITAVRHGNGRDWWITVPALDGKKYLNFLSTPQGVVGPVAHTCTSSVKPLWTGQVAFSPDGSWFADCQGNSAMRLMRFDRCSGSFYEERVMNFQGDTVEATGVAFSPNSKVMYISTPVKIWQYDLTVADISASRQVVAEYDGFAPNGFATTFFQAMLAPDNKIYLTATNSTRFLHVIHAPDSLGTFCRVQQHGLEIPTRHAFMVPNFPYFRLYDLPGSACDTLGINGPVSAVGEPGGAQPLDLHLYPLPASEVLSVEFGAGAAEGSWQVVDMSGRVLRSGQKAALDAALVLPVGDLLSGMYAFRFRSADGALAVRRFTVIR